MITLIGDAATQQHRDTHSIDRNGNALYLSRTASMRFDDFQRLLMVITIGTGAAIGMVVAGVRGVIAGIAIASVIGVIVGTTLIDTDQD